MIRLTMNAPARAPRSASKRAGIAAGFSRITARADAGPAGNPPPRSAPVRFPGAQFHSVIYDI